MAAKREDFGKPETPEERATRLKAREERKAAHEEEKAAALAAFNAKVDAIRPKVVKRLCPTCREVGSYYGMVRGQHDLYIVSFKCSINHHWSVTVGKLEAHALRPIEMDTQPNRPIPASQVTSYRVPEPTESPPLVPDPEPLPLAEGTPAAQPLVPDPVPEAVPGPAPVLTSGPVCGSCSGPLGAKYYAGVPTVGGKLDLCMPCWEAWRER